MATANRGGVIGLDHGTVLDASIKHEHLPALGRLVKRAFDLTVATLILLALAPCSCSRWRPSG